MTKDSITVYSLPSCSMCRNLKNRLTRAGIEFTNCEDEEEERRLGMDSVPMMQVNDGPLMNYKEALTWVSEHEEND